MTKGLGTGSIVYSSGCADTSGTSCLANVPQICGGKANNQLEEAEEASRLSQLTASPTSYRASAQSRIWGSDKSCTQMGGHPQGECRQAEGVMGPCQILVQLTSNHSGGGWSVKLVVVGSSSVPAGLSHCKQEQKMSFV